MKKLYVGNLPYSINSDQLKELFAKFGEVISATVITDKFNNNRSKGFGFVEMEDDAAEKAMSEMNGKEVDGRELTVNEARPMQPRN